MVNIKIQLKLQRLYKYRHYVIAFIGSVLVYDLYLYLGLG